MRRTRTTLLALLIGSILPTTADAEGNQWHDRLEPTGSFRLRYEDILTSSESEDTRKEGFLIRLRAGFDYEIKKDRFKVGVQLRSGDPENPVSDNRAIQGLNTDDFSIKEAWLDFTPAKDLDLRFGMFEPRRLWKVSDLQWDNDVTVTGALQEIRPKQGSGVLDLLGFSFYQYLLERSQEGDAWLLGAQVRPELILDDSNKLNLGAEFDYYGNPQSIVDLSLTGQLKGNKITNLLDEDNHLISDFRVASLFAEWSNTSSARWPLHLAAYYYKNLGAGDEVGTETGISGARAHAGENDTAIFARAETGRYDQLGHVQVRYTYYQSEPDALLYAYMQSDTKRASNLKGSRGDLWIGLISRTFLHITYYRTRALIGARSTIHSWFFDYVIRF